MYSDEERKILEKHKEIFEMLEEYDKTGKPISRIVEEKFS